MKTEEKSDKIAGANEVKLKGDNPFLHVIRSTGYSIEGLASALKHEMAFRMEFILALILVPVALLLPVSLVLSLALVSSVLIVLMVELLNSAIETTIDYISLKQHPLAKRAKDIGSAAVFLALLNCGIWWVYAILSVG